MMIILSFLYFLNHYLGGTPRYYEVLYNTEEGTLRSKKEKLVYYKRNTKINSSQILKVYDQKYKNLKYEGQITSGNCGSLEDGNIELIYQTDKNGFRENIESLYNYSDLILLGDSFTMSICMNKPYDLKSNIIKNFPDKKILNLGKHGEDYPGQLKNLIYFTKKTNFETLIWFFYEGNDYETKIVDKKKFKLFIDNQITKIRHNNYRDDHKFSYQLNNKFEISLIYKLKVFFSEILSGLSTLITFGKNYPQLLDFDNYNYALQIANDFLKMKKVKNKYVFYIPSWQKLSLHKIKSKNILKNHSKLNQFATMKANVKKAAIANGFKFIDGDKFFYELDNPLDVFHYELNTHFNNLGYKILSDGVSKILMNK